MVNWVRLGGCHTPHWHLVKAVTSLLIIAAVLSPPEFTLHASVAANLFWIWVEP